MLTGREASFLSALEMKRQVVKWPPHGLKQLDSLQSIYGGVVNTASVHLHYLLIGHFFCNILKDGSRHKQNQSKDSRLI